MKFCIAILVFLVLTESTNAQSLAIDSVENIRILIGPIKPSYITDSIWYKENYNAALVKAKQLKIINKKSGDVTVEVYFGTWCSDSRYWVPAFIGLMDKTDLAKKIDLIALSRSKKTKETARLKEIIDKVPTFVFWRDGKEIGRIVETPEVTLVNDIIWILKN